MDNSRRLAGLIGPVVILLAITEQLNLYVLAKMDPPVVYLHGVLLFIAGLAIVKVHNHWKGWPVLITITGWVLMVVFGLYRAFVPEAGQGGTGIFNSTIFLILFLTGAFLTFKGYSVEEGSSFKSKRNYLLIIFLALLTIFQVLISFLHLRVPRTVEFDNSLSFTEIGGYKYHTEIFGNPDSFSIIVVHGGPGLDFQYLKPLKKLSERYQVIFYDQRGSGLSPRVDKKYLTMAQSLEDLHSLVSHFSNGKKVKLIGHSWGAMLVVGYLSIHPETVSQAVIIEPACLYPGAPVQDWVGRIKKEVSFWGIIPYLPSYPFVVKEDGQEGYDYVGTKIATRYRPGPPYNCEGQDLPPNTFVRFGYESFRNLLQPILDNPDAFVYDLTKGISGYKGDLLLMSSECSILGFDYQEKYNIPKLPPQTVHVKAYKMGHHMVTLNPEWSIQTIWKFLNTQH